MRRQGAMPRSGSGRMRKLTAIPMERPQRKVSHRASTFLPPVQLQLECIEKASEKEKQFQYDSYRVTGDFERDFTLLCHLIDLKLPLIHRPKIPSTCISPSETFSQYNRSGSTLPLTEESISRNDTDVPEPLPTTYVVAENKYDNLKPRVEMETEFESNKEYVRHLYFRGWKVDTRIVNILFKTVPDFERLKVLNMGNAGLDDETLYCLGRCVALIPSLKTLCLDGNCHTANQRFQVFLEDTGQLKLQFLSLRHCNLNEDGALNISESLSDNKHLLTLNLNSNKLGDKGACHLANSLRVNRTLLSLNISSNGIGDEGVKKLAESISTFALTHDEVVTRRRLQQSARVRTANGTPVYTSPSPLNNTGGKHLKTSKKKTGKGREKRPKSSIEIQSDTINEDESLSSKNPLLEKSRLVDGELYIAGNRTLINLNLSRNKLTQHGLQFLCTAVKYQSELTLGSKATTSNGLMKLSLQKNCFSVDDPRYSLIRSLLQEREPHVRQFDSISEE